jgi:hypothetical protein
VGFLCLGYGLGEKGKEIFIDYSLPLEKEVIVFCVGIGDVDYSLCRNVRISTGFYKKSIELLHLFSFLLLIIWLAILFAI